MPQNPNLVPTQITNKNGVRTTVHRKPASGATTQRKLPAPAQTHTAANRDASVLLGKLTPPDGVSADSMERAYKYYFYGDPELQSIAEKMLTTGTSTGQRLVRDIFSTSLKGLAENYEQNPNGPHRRLNKYKVLRDIMPAWAYGNIREESKQSPDTITDEDLDQVRHIHSLVTMYESAYDNIPEEDLRVMSTAVEDHWRGVSALSLCFDPDTSPDEMWNHFDDFIAWSAHHPDLQSVIEVASTHDTIIPADLEHLIDARKSGISNALTDGWV